VRHIRDSVRIGRNSTTDGRGSEVQEAGRRPRVHAHRPLGPRVVPAARPPGLGEFDVAGLVFHPLFQERDGVAIMHPRCRQGGAAALRAQRTVGSSGRDGSWISERPDEFTVASVADRRRLRRSHRQIRVNPCSSVSHSLRWYLRLSAVSPAMPLCASVSLRLCGETTIDDPWRTAPSSGLSS
jgi:hypothetical protein